MRGRHIFFATCAPGIEPVLHAEAKALRLAKLERQVGGVRFEGTMEDAWRANLWLRTAVRVLLRLERFEALDENALYERVKAFDWAGFVGPEGTFVVDAQTRDSELNHSRYIEQRVKDAVADRFRERTGVRPSVDRTDPDLRIHVHIFRNRATLSVDTSGDSLHKRGWRRHQGRAPLAETLAAAIVRFSRWDGRAPLVDPFCGSGTILVEAALIAANSAPGLFRQQFGFERWPGHEPAAFARAKDAARALERVPGKLQIVGSDVDPARIEEARENVAAAGLEGRIELQEADARDFAPRPGWNAWIVTNPPYGERVGAVARLVPVYQRFGERVRTGCGGYHLALLSGEETLARALGIAPDERVALVNGALECELLLAAVP
ncbi:MAG: RNA methyltransferase [Planctomycetota bacterium]|nr:MAG: RNA methyltransferase [Planctomycetota bacterium]